MPKHTDGTWVYIWGFVRRRENEQILAGVTLTGTDGESDANGRLMAAAPRMFRLLEELATSSCGVRELRKKAKALLKELDA